MLYISLGCSGDGESSITEGLRTALARLRQRSTPPGSQTSPLHQPSNVSVFLNDYTHFQIAVLYTKRCKMRLILIGRILKFIAFSRYWNIPKSFSSILRKLFLNIVIFSFGHQQKYVINVYRILFS